MDRQNRHHYCEGGCKTHTRRTYRLLYTEAAGGAGAREWINMSNTQTGRRIPFETGSINLHSVLALHRQHPLPTLDGMRQMLMLMFLSLPVFQDPAPWNVVWRGGELFPIDVGDGLTLEERPKPWEPQMVFRFSPGTCDAMSMQDYLSLVGLRASVIPSSPCSCARMSARLWAKRV